jgi:hypothetical protein
MRDRRSKGLFIRLSEGEKEALDWLSKKKGTPLATFTRRIAVEYASLAKGRDDRDKNLIERYEGQATSATDQNERATYRLMASWAASRRDFNLECAQRGVQAMLATQVAGIRDEFGADWESRDRLEVARAESSSPHRFMFEAITGQQLKGSPLAEDQPKKGDRK